MTKKARIMEHILRPSPKGTRLSQSASVSRATTPTRGLIPGAQYTTGVVHRDTVTTALITTGRYVRCSRSGQREWEARAGWLQLFSL
jgi:hypothetical protein